MSGRGERRRRRPKCKVKGALIGSPASRVRRPDRSWPSEPSGGRPAREQATPRQRRAARLQRAPARHVALARRHQLGARGRARKRAHGGRGGVTDPSPRARADGPRSLRDGPRKAPLCALMAPHERCGRSDSRKLPNSLGLDRFENPRVASSILALSTLLLTGGKATIQHAMRPGVFRARDGFAPCRLPAARTCANRRTGRE